MDKEGIIKACESSLTMAEAARKMEIPHMTFRRYAISLGVYKPNQGQKGIKRPLKSLEDVFSGKVKMRSYNLRTRLIQEGYKENKCEDCGINEWNGKALVLELDHKNGDHDDNRLENLQILCPNCHSQTPTFRRSARVENGSRA